MRALQRFLIFVMFLCVAATAPAAAADRHLQIALVAETDTPAPGESVTLALDSRPEPGWHGYWLNPGDAGLAPRFDWTLPAGATLGAMRWPAPEPLLLAGLMNHAYGEPYAPLVELRLPAGIAPGTRLPIRVKASYLVCSDRLCVPERAELALELFAGDGRVTAERRAQFDRWHQALPRPLGARATFMREDDGALTLSFPVPAAVAVEKPWFFPVVPGMTEAAHAQEASRDGDRLILRTRGSPGGAIEGVLRTGPDQSFLVTAEAGVVAAPSGHWAAALIAFAGAVLGGLLLNAMPCVFPILSLKVLGLARSGEASAARREAIGYTAGAVLTCSALGATILALRAAGSAVGWAFQLQNPAMILVLMLLSIAIALNLAGLFELRVPAFARRGGGTGAFATGALAAFVATPCTGPFMGAALGAALILPPAAALAVFAGLGLGLALPFLLVGFVPSLRRLLPRPGPWMPRLQRWLSVPMWLTALALGWVLGQQSGVDGLMLGLAAALTIGLALWVYGRRQREEHGGAFALAMAAVALVLAPLALTQAPAPAVAADAAAEAFTEARVAELQRQQRPVFAYFTAAWCITCKVNEKAAIDTAGVRRAFADKRIAVLRGDWTDGDPALGRFLAAHGRAGVPLYLYYPAGGGAPRVLPQLLTPAMLTALDG